MMQEQTQHDHELHDPPPYELSENFRLSGKISISNFHLFSFKVTYKPHNSDYRS